MLRRRPEDQPLRNVPNRTGPKLTFGVELEMALATLELLQEDPSPTDCRQVSYFLPCFESPWTTDPVNGKQYYIHKSIASELTKAGRPSEAETATITHEYNPNSWIVKQDTSIRAPHECDVYGDHKPDDLCNPSPSTAYTWHGIEITTPPYYASDTSFAAVKAGCEVIAKTFRVNTNPSCGLHIHVGCGTEGLSFATMRNLFATLLTFESQIDQIHGIYRLADRVHCCYGLRKSMLKNLTRDPKDIGKAGLEYFFYRCTGLRELAERVSFKGGVGTFDRMGYNMNNLLLSKDGVKKTMEFRQHKGTIDPVTVTNWATFCVRLVEFADTVDSTVLEEFLTRHVDDTPKTFGIGEVCVAIGAPELARYFERYVREQKVRDAATAEQEGGLVKAARLKADAAAKRKQVDKKQIQKTNKAMKVRRKWAMRIYDPDFSE